MFKFYQLFCLVVKTIELLRYRRRLTAQSKRICGMPSAWTIIKLDLPGRLRRTSPSRCADLHKIFDPGCVQHCLQGVLKIGLRAVTNGMTKFVRSGFNRFVT